MSKYFAAFVDCLFKSVSNCQKHEHYVEKTARRHEEIDKLKSCNSWPLCLHKNIELPNNTGVFVHRDDFNLYIVTPVGSNRTRRTINSKIFRSQFHQYKNQKKGVAAVELLTDNSRLKSKNTQDYSSCCTNMSLREHAADLNPI